MQKLIALFLSFFVLASFNVNAAVNQSKIHWTTNYQDALNQSKTNSKPVLLFFTGSDWCSWCHKLENEALNTDAFYQAAGDKFNFVLLDFPSSGSGANSSQNNALQQKFGVSGFPTIVILDSNGNKLGSTGYQPGGGAAYAQHLLNFIKH